MKYGIILTDKTIGTRAVVAINNYLANVSPKDTQEILDEQIKTGENSQLPLSTILELLNLMACNLYPQYSPFSQSPRLVEKYLNLLIYYEGFYDGIGDNLMNV